MKTIKIIRFVEKSKLIPMFLKMYLLHRLYVKYGKELEEREYKLNRDTGEFILSCMK